MYIFLIIVHITVCLILIVTILLQAGRGAGLTDMFGGGESAQSVLGTQAPAILKKVTEISAVAFLVTSLALGMVTARRGRSIFDRAKLPALPTMPQKQVPAAAAGQEASVSAEVAEAAQASDQAVGE